MSIHIEIIAIAIFVAAACALPGTFLVLRKRSLLSDAISHAVLPGIAIGFFLTENLNSPFLMVGAILSGLLTAWATELLSRTKKVKEDAAIGLVFPIFFSVGVILISRYAGKVHLGTDVVLLGELAFAPFERFKLFNVDLGPKTLWTMGLVFLLNMSLVLLFFKELKLSTFDPELAHAKGFHPKVIHYSLMTIVSITVVSAFDSVGSILVVALMIAPATAAFMLTQKLHVMLVLSAIIGAVSSIIGYGIAVILDVSIAGAMATMCGVSFFIAWLFAPKRGLVALRILRNQQKLELGVRVLVVHLSHHGGYDGSQRNEAECNKGHLTTQINWTSTFADKVVAFALKEKLVFEKNNILYLYDEGLVLARNAMLQ